MALLLLTACAGGPPAAVVTKGVGERVACHQPGPEALRDVGASVNVGDIAGIVKGGLSVATKVQRIRELHPKDAGFDVVAWRLCEAYQNGIIDKKTYEDFIRLRIESQVPLAERPATVAGLIREKDPAGKPLGGVEVVVAGARTFTLPDGTFTLQVQPQAVGQRVPVAAQKEGYQPGQGFVVLDPRTPARVDLQLALIPKTFFVRGRVANPEGAGLEGATVRLKLKKPQQARSQSDGGFRFEVPREEEGGVAMLEVQQPGFRLFSKEYQLSPQMAAIEVALAPATFNLLGRAIVQGLNEPKEGVEIRLALDPPLTAVSRSDGGFRLAVPAEKEGQFATLTARAPGYKPVTREVRLAPDPQPVVVELAREGFEVTGQALEGEGTPRPLAGVEVTLGSGPDRKTQRTGPDGHFRFLVDLSLQGRQLPLAASLRGYEAYRDTVTVQEGMAPLSLPLTKLKPFQAFEQGQRLLKEGNYLASLTHFEQATRLDPNYEEAHFLWATALSKLGRYEEAAERYRRAAELAPRRVDVFLDWAFALVKLGRHEEALARYRSAAELAPERGEIFLDWATALVKLGRFVESIPHYRRAAELMPKRAEVQIAWAQALVRAERFGETLERYKKALELDGNQVEALFDWAAALEKLRRYEESAAKYEEYIARKPDRAQAFFNLAQVYLKLKRDADAYVTHQKGKKIQEGQVTPAVAPPAPAPAPTRPAGD